jgi:hypothetical protein
LAGARRECVYRFVGSRVSEAGGSPGISRVRVIAWQTIKSEGEFPYRLVGMRDLQEWSTLLQMMNNKIVELPNRLTGRRIETWDVG